jgi:hypothetical protein
MNNALALAHPNPLPATLAQSLTELPFGSQSQVQTAQGRISAFLGYAGCDYTVGIAKYALRVLNNTGSAAQARLLIDVRGVQSNAYPLSFDIAPYSMRDDMVPVRLDELGPFDRRATRILPWKRRLRRAARARGKNGARLRWSLLPQHAQ